MKYPQINVELNTAFKHLVEYHYFSYYLTYYGHLKKKQLFHVNEIICFAIICFSYFA